jgi:predicted DNA-binding protein
MRHPRLPLANAKVDRPYPMKINLSKEEKEALTRMIRRTGKNGAELIREFILGEP